MALEGDVQSYLIRALIEREEWAPFDAVGLTKGEALEYINIIVNGDPTFKATDTQLADINTKVLLIQAKKPNDDEPSKAFTAYNRYIKEFEKADQQFCDLLADLLEHSNSKLTKGLEALAQGPTDAQLKFSEKQLLSLLARRLMNVRSLQFRHVALLHILALFGSPDLTLQMSGANANAAPLLPAHVLPWKDVIDKVSKLKLSPAQQVMLVTRYASAHANLAFPVILSIPSPAATTHRTSAPSASRAPTVVEPVPGHSSRVELPAPQVDLRSSAATLSEALKAYPSDAQCMLAACKASAEQTPVVKLSSTGRWWICLLHKNTPTFKVSLPPSPTTATAPVTAPTVLPEPVGSNPSAHTPPTNKKLDDVLALVQTPVRTAAQDQTLAKTAKELSQDELLDLEQRLEASDRQALYRDLLVIRGTLAPVSGPHGAPSVPPPPLADEHDEYTYTEKYAEHQEYGYEEQGGAQDHQYFYTEHGEAIDVAQLQARVVELEQQQHETVSTIEAMASRLKALEKAAKQAALPAAPVQGVAPPPPAAPQAERSISSRLKAIQQSSAHALGEPTATLLSDPALAQQPAPQSVPGRVVRATEPKLVKNGNVADFLTKMQIFFSLTGTPAHEQIDRTLLNIEDANLVNMWMGYLKSDPTATPTFADFSAKPGYQWVPQRSHRLRIPYTNLCG